VDGKQASASKVADDVDADRVERHVEVDLHCIRRFVVRVTRKKSEGGCPSK
jgi:hypothetical protein